jgi:hypothetical protein
LKSKELNEGRKPIKVLAKNGDLPKSEMILVPVGKDYSLPDGAGLHLIVTSSGGKW